MVFKLDTAGDFYSSEDKEKLEELGFSFVNAGKYNFQKVTARDENALPTIEIVTLEDLLDFAKKWGDLIIEPSGNKIYVYDNYLG